MRQFRQTTHEAGTSHAKDTQQTKQRGPWLSPEADSELQAPRDGLPFGSSVQHDPNR